MTKKLVLFFLLFAFLFFVSRSVFADTDTFTFWQDDTVGNLHVIVNNADQIDFALVWANASGWQGWQWQIISNDQNSTYADLMLTVLTTGKPDNSLPDDLNDFLVTFSQFQQSPVYNVYLPMVAGGQ